MQEKNGIDGRGEDVAGIAANAEMASGVEAEKSVWEPSLESRTSE